MRVTCAPGEAMVIENTAVALPLEILLKIPRDCAIDAPSIGRVDVVGEDRRERAWWWHGFWGGEREISTGRLLQLICRRQAF